MARRGSKVALHGLLPPTPTGQETHGAKAQKHQTDRFRNRCPKRRPERLELRQLIRCQAGEVRRAAEARDALAEVLREHHEIVEVHRWIAQEVRLRPSTGLAEVLA